MNNQDKENVKTLKDSWEKLVFSILSIFKKSYGRYLIKETKLRRENSHIKIIEDIKFDFFSWIYNHEKEITDLQEYKDCLEKTNSIFEGYEKEMKKILFGFSIDCFETYNYDEKEKFFDEIYEKYMDSLSLSKHEPNKYIYVHFCPLFNFNSKEERIIINEKLIIRRINDYEFDELSKIVDRNQLVFQYPYFVIEYTSEVDDDSPIDTIIFALRLIKTGTIWGGIKFARIISPVWEKARFSRRKSFGYIPYSYGNILEISEDDIQYIKRNYNIVTKILDQKFLERYKDLRLAIKWFNKFYDEEDVENRFMFLIIIIEALCSDSVETKYKLSNRVAITIGKNYEDILNIRECLKKIYDGPRNIFHGGDKTIEKWHLSFLEKVVRELLKSFISLNIRDSKGDIDYSTIKCNYIGENQKNKKKIKNIIDDAILSIEKREKFDEQKDFDNILDQK